MNTRAFVLLLVGVLAVGGSLGGAFVGGIALGKSQGDETAAQSTLPAQSSFSPNQPPSGQLSQDQIDQFRQRLQSGEIDPQDLAQLRQGQLGQGFAGRGGLTGTIEEIEGNTVTVNTAQGPLLATVGEETTIQMFTEGTLADLQTGLRVNVIGQRGEDGAVEATSIVVTPEGADGFFGGRQQREQQSP